MFPGQALENRRWKSRELRDYVSVMGPEISPEDAARFSAGLKSPLPEYSGAIQCTAHVAPPNLLSVRTR
jgi:hypothetical protein